MKDELFLGGIGPEDRWRDPGRGDHRLDSSRLEDPLRSLPLRPPVRVQLGSDAGDAIRKMRDAGVGSCVVENVKGSLAGIVTERDVLNKVPLDGIRLDKTPVEEFMQHDPETLALDHPIAYALHNMSGGGYRNIPVVDDSNHAVALVTLRDIVDEVCDNFSEQVQCIPPRRRLGIASEREGA